VTIDEHSDSAGQVSLRPPVLGRVLVAAVTTLSLASYAAQVLVYEFDIASAKGFVPLFDATREANIPTWYSTMALLACAGASACVALTPPRNGLARPAGRRWIVVAALLLLAALDEGAAIHDVLDENIDIPDLSGALRFAWIVPAGLVAAAAVPVVWQVAADLRSRTRLQFLVGIAVWAGAALVLEAAEGLLIESEGGKTLDLALLSTTQESLEMAGVALMLLALVNQLAAERSRVAIRFEPDS
jgi:hypothetical protein